MSEIVDTSFMGQPTGTEDASLGDNRIRAFKLAWKERMEKEHNMDLTEAGSQPRQGLHKAGSAVSFYQASAPTTRNGIALSSSDAGLSWVDSDTDDLYIWNGTNWVHVGGPGSVSDYRFQGKIQRITSGSGNWTVPAGVYRIRVTCVGGGGGGGGTGAGSQTGGASGNQTTFYGASTGAGGGGGGAGYGNTIGGRGGEGASGGAGASGTSGSKHEGFGGAGGGAGGRDGGYLGGPGETGSYGGGGGGATVASSNNAAAGGGGGGTIISAVIGDVITVVPGSDIAYSVGAGGDGGSAGASGYAGGAGGSGIIIIEY